MEGGGDAGSSSVAVEAPFDPQHARDVIYESPEGPVAGRRDRIGEALEEFSELADPSIWKERMNCSVCTKKRKFFCPDCLVPIPPGKDIGNLLGPMTLPLKVDLLFKDNRAKATGLHAKVLAPECVAVHELWDYKYHINGIDEASQEIISKVPDYKHEEALVVFPSSDSVYIDEVENLEKVKTLIMIESTWQKTVKFLEIPQVKILRRVRLRHLPPASYFWRWHTKGTHCISTIEALFTILLEYCRHREIVKGNTPSEDDTFGLNPLLFIFALQHKFIKTQHDPQNPHGDPSKQRQPLPMLQSAKDDQVEKRHLANRKRAQAKHEHHDPQKKKCPESNANAGTGEGAAS